MLNKLVCVLLTLCLSGKALCNDTYVIVFDTSGSMGEYMRAAKKTRLEVAKEALIDVLSNLPKTTKVGVLTFNGWVYDISSIDDQVLENSIKNINNQGGTPLYTYMKLGATKLLQEREKNNNVGLYKLIVVTDGAASDAQLDNGALFADFSPKLGVLQDIISRGIIVDTIALEIPGDHSLKKSINGNYMKGDDPSSLKQSLSKSMAEVKLDDSISNDAFKALENLPDSFLENSLKALTTFGNHPIGDKPPKPPKPPEPKPDTTSVITPKVMKSLSNTPITDDGTKAVTYTLSIAAFIFFFILFFIVLKSL